MARVELARDILGYANATVENLFAEPSTSTLGIANLGGREHTWLKARKRVEAGLKGADAVLLAYGVSEPTGPARLHFREQIAWLNARITAHRLPVWTLGGRPSHPSRWQRWTSRTYPGLDFQEALRFSFRPLD